MESGSASTTTATVSWMATCRKGFSHELTRIDTNGRNGIYFSLRRDDLMDIERTMEFILAQQARFAEQQARFEEQQAKFAERQAQHEERQAKFEADLIQINAILLDVASTQARTNAIVEVLAQRLIDLTAQVADLGAKLDRHIDSHN